MRKTVFVVIFLHVLLIKCFSQETGLYKEVITIDTSGLFQRDISYTIQTEKNKKKLKVVYNENESVKIREVYYVDSKGKKKKIRKGDISDGILRTSSFYSNLKEKYWFVPASKGHFLELDMYFS